MLPVELLLLMQSINNTQVSCFLPATCVHHEFVCQVIKHPQKLAVQLDDQSLTYSRTICIVFRWLIALILLNRTIMLFLAILSVNVWNEVYQW